VIYTCVPVVTTTTDGGGGTTDGGKTDGDKGQSAEEMKWLQEILKDAKDDAERKEIEDAWKDLDHEGRRKFYDKIKGAGKDGAGGAFLTPAPATIVVTLPAEAKLTIDDAATASTSSPRVFMSPALSPGKAYHYTLKAEYTKDGKPVTVSRQIEVRAGAETRVDLNDTNVTVASK